MICFVHTEREAVATCGKCGVAMCKECEEKAFMRLDNGKGQALCNRCSASEAEENIGFAEKWLSKRKIKLIICTILIVLGFLSFMMFKHLDLETTAYFLVIVFWAASGAVAIIGHEKNYGSIKSQVQQAAFDYEHPILSSIIKILVNAVFGPILLVAHYIGYFRTKAELKKSIELLEEIRASGN